MKFDFRIELMDSVEEVPLPRRLSEVFPFVRTLWAFQAGVFWMLALELEMMMMLVLMEKIPWLGKRHCVEERLYRLADGVNDLRDRLQCKLYYMWEIPTLPEAAKSLIKAVNYAWGWSLMTEGYLLENLSSLIPNGKLKNRLMLRVASVCIAGSNLQTEGRSFPNIEHY